MDEDLLIAIQNAANTIAAPNWADIMGVCLSLLAVIVACFVAWRQNEISRKQTFIADNQNKIALFEKRLEIYDVLLSCSTSVKIEKMVDENEDILEYLFVLFAKIKGEYREFDRNEARLYLMNCSSKLELASLLFPKEIAEYVFNISFALLILVNTDAKVDGPERYNEIKRLYFETIKDFDENKIITSIKKEMKMI